MANFFRNINWSKWQTIIQIPIFAIMAWATVESYEMRKISQEQTAKNSLPFIVFDLQKNGNAYSISPLLKNVGYGPALNIKLSKITNRNSELSFHDVNGLENGGQITLNYEITSVNDVFYQRDSTEFYSFLSDRGKHFMGRTPDNDLGFLRITYQDLLGNKYCTEQKLIYNIVENEIDAEIIKYPDIFHVSNN